MKHLLFLILMVVEFSACTPNAQTVSPTIDSEKSVNSSPVPPENPENEQPSLNEEVVFLISGQIDSIGARLEPILEIEGTPNLPINGPYKLQALGSNDEILLEYSFAAVRLSHTTEELKQFTFSIPINKSLLERVKAYRIVLTKKGGEAELARIESIPTDNSASFEIIPSSVERLKGGLVRFIWDSTLYPKVIVYDGPKGNILAIAEDGEIVIFPTTDTLSVTFSDGIYSETRDIEIPLR